MRRRTAALMILGASALTLGFVSASEAAAVRRDLGAARALLSDATKAGGSATKLRVDHLDLSVRLSRGAYRRTRRFPLQTLAAVPYLGRDLRVAQAVAEVAVQAAAATREAFARLVALEEGEPDAAKLQASSRALERLHGVLGLAVSRVEAAGAVLSRNARSEFLAQARAARAKARSAAAIVGLAARLYGPEGSTRYFLAFQNPAELRGTGGLIGQYAILESAPNGPRLTELKTIHDLEARTKAVGDSEGRYERFFPRQVWTSVNVSPDMPTAGRTLLDLYESMSGERLDGVLAIDPHVAAAVLAGRPAISVDGVRLDATNLVRMTTVDAYVRFAGDNERRVRFLSQIARHTFRAAMEGFRSDPQQLGHALAKAARERHFMVYAAEPGLQQAFESLGFAGEASAPAAGDYLMPSATNTGGNKLDAFVRRSIDYRVRLAPDASAKATVEIAVENTAAIARLPRYIVGPFDGRFRAGDAWLFQSMYVAGAYEFTSAREGGRVVSAEARPDLGALALSRNVVVPAGATTTLTYELERRNALQIEEERMVYRLQVRPQAMINPDSLSVSVTAPGGWHFVSLPAGFTGSTTALRTASFTRTESLMFVLARTRQKEGGT